VVAVKAAVKVVVIAAEVALTAVSVKVAVEVALAVKVEVALKVEAVAVKVAVISVAVAVDWVNKFFPSFLSPSIIASSDSHLLACPIIRLNLLIPTSLLN